MHNDALEIRRKDTDYKVDIFHIQGRETGIISREVSRKIILEPVVIFPEAIIYSLCDLKFYILVTIPPPKEGNT